MKFTWDKTINGFRFDRAAGFLAKEFRLFNQRRYYRRRVFRRVWRRVSDNYYFWMTLRLTCKRSAAKKNARHPSSFVDGGFIKRTLRENSYTLTDLGASFLGILSKKI